MCIHVNPLKVERDNYWAKLKKREKIDAKKCENSPFGILFPPLDTNIQEMRDFKEGMFEICDEGPQLLGMRVKVEPGQKVLDLTGTAGSRALTYGPYMKVFLSSFISVQRNHIHL